MLRMAAALNPTWCGLGVFVFCVIGQELLFRGWLQTRVGPVLSVVVFAMVIHPLNPVRVLPIAIALAGLRAKSNSVIPPIVARLVWGLLALQLAPISPWSALIISFILPCVFWVFVRGESR